jgi:hypothetical protein
VSKHHTMKIVIRVVVKFHMFLILALDGSGWSASGS